MPAGSNTPQAIEATTSGADQYSLPYTPYALATDRAGNLFIADFVGYGQYYEPPALYNLEKLPAGSSSIQVVYSNYMNVLAMTCDAGGNLFVSNYAGGVNQSNYLAGMNELPSGSSSLVPIPGAYPNAIGIALDAAGNLLFD